MSAKETSSSRIESFDRSHLTMEILPFTPEQMRRRVARFDELEYPRDQYIDMHLPGHDRKNFLVIGAGLKVKGGKEPMPAIKIAEGFQLSYVKARPGNGPRLHNHDTNETFVAMKGVWRVIWGLGEAHSVDLRPLDVCAVPAFVPRRFICLVAPKDSEEGLLMAIHPGDNGRAEYIDKDLPSAG